MRAHSQRGLVRWAVRSAIAVAISTTAVSPALAEEAPPAPGPARASSSDKLEEVVVTGFRESLNLALDRVSLTMVAYLDELQQPNGLFLHSPDSPFYWGRGNGWVAAGMAEVLSVLPPQHPRYARIMQSYRLMMAGLLRYQNQDGLWLQLIDQPDFWPETSGSAMFAFAMVEGVKRGWLDAHSYGPAARKAWLGLVTYVDSAANIRETVVGTNKASNEVGPDLQVQKKFYFDRPRRTGDLHGQSPMLWTTAALLR